MNTAEVITLIICATIAVIAWAEAWVKRKK
jgi:hypothetical protein